MPRHWQAWEDVLRVSIVRKTPSSFWACGEREMGGNQLIGAGGDTVGEENNFYYSTAQ